MLQFGLDQAHFSLINVLADFNVFFVWQYGLCHFKIFNEGWDRPNSPFPM